MKLFLMFVLTQFLILTCFGQQTENKDLDLIESLNKNSLNVEVFGNGLFGSIYYERLILSNYNNKMHAGLSVGFTPPISIFSPMVPMEAKFIYGNTHCIEFGYGLTFIPNNIFNPTYNPATGRNNRMFYPVFRIGYRLLYKHLVFRIAPLYHRIKNTEPRYRLHGGASIGLSF